MAALCSIVRLLVTTFIVLWKIQCSYSQSPDTSDPCASSATQLHSGDAAYFPSFDYPTGVRQDAANGGDREGEEAGDRSKRAATSLHHRLWPDGVIYYLISNLYTAEEKRVILEAMMHWENHTCIRFQQRTTQRVYINVFPGSGCCSYVGRLGYGVQGVSVARGCFTFYTVVHELGHVIGFWHEQSRPDRDQYIEVILANVLTGYEFNFDKKDENLIDSQGVGYDYNSIMHYDRNAFARFPGFYTMRARDPTIPIGMARELSELDILQTNRLYNCNVNNMPPPRVVLPETAPTVAPTLPPLPYPSCGEVFVNASGSFSSPGYPTYTHNTDCVWMINGPPGHWLRLSFEPLRIEYSHLCEKDYIILETSFEGNTAARRCGHFYNLRFSSHSNTVLVRYHTDGDNSEDSRQTSGFQVSYESFDIDECYTAGCTQECHNYPGSYSCSCRDGWFLSADGVTCFDMNECAIENGGCEHHCTNTGGSFYCRCDQGFNLEPDGKRCRVPGTSCSFRNGGCSHHCNDTGPSRVCSCNDGYSLQSDQRNCRDIDECATSSTTLRCQHSCVNTPGSYRCECNSGFILGEDQHSCTPERTCARNNGGCSHSCRDSNDGAVCSCPQGYYLGNDQMTCEDTDECLNSRLCGHVCVNTNGSYHCDCWEGYSLDSDRIFCRNINECLDGSNLCQFKELCRDNHGSYTCRCPSGYTLNEDGHSCKDNDECATGYHICSHGCHNLNGSYECTCPPGFTLQDLYTCRDVDECATGLDQCDLLSGATCRNTDGSYSCLCHDGYKTDDSGFLCIDVDECSDAGSHDCKEGSECVNSEGSYECVCSLGYQLSEDGSSCQLIATTAQPTAPTTSQETPTTVTVPPDTMTTGTAAGAYPATTTTIESTTTTTTTSTSFEASQPNQGESSTTTTTSSLTASNSDKLSTTTTASPVTETTTIAAVRATTEAVACVAAGCEHVCRVKANRLSAECFCRDGYVLAQDGRSCVDINECSDGRNGGCQVYCRNFAGSYECLCRLGYSLEADGSTCKDIDECEVNNGGCDQTCTNMPGNYACNCAPEHYLAIDGRTCVPFNFNPNPPPPPTSTTSRPPTTSTAPPITTSIPPTTVSIPPPATSIPPPTTSMLPTTPSSNRTSSTITTMAVTTHTTSPASEESPTVAGPLCGGELRSESGTFQTLNWPQTYPVNVDCEWDIEISDTDKVIEISFDSSVFGIAGRLPSCEKDWLKVYDGHNVNDTSFWGPFCHYRVPDTIKTSSYQAKILFHAGPIHNPSRRGFKASYASVDRPVVQVIPQNPTGHFTCRGFYLVNRNFGPPEFPNPITTSTGSSCSWSLATASSISYAFKLIYFNIPGSPGCHSNSLKVYRGIITTPENLLATLCGDLTEEDMTIEGGASFMTVVMEVNDRSVSFRGFYGYFAQQNS